MSNGKTNIQQSFAEKTFTTVHKKLPKIIFELMNSITLKF